MPAIAANADLALIIRAVDQASGPLASIDRALGGLDTRAKGVGTSLANVAGGMAKLAAGAAITGIGALAGVLGVATVKAAEFEKTLSGIKAVSGATAAEMELISAKALEIGEKTAFSASEAAKAIEELSKAGLSVSDILSGAAEATVNLAAAGGVDMVEAATIASNALAQFNLKGKDMAHVADLIAGAANASAIDVSQFGYSLSQAGAVAATVGFTFDDLSQAIAVMGKAGIVGSDAGTSLKTMMLNLQPSTDKAAKEMERLGIMTKDGANRFFDASGKVKSMADVADILKVAMKDLTEQQRIASLEVLFGSDAIRAAAVLSKEGAAGFNEMAGAMGKVTAAAVGAEKLNNLSGDIETLKGSAETLAIKIGMNLTPAFRELTQWANNTLNAHGPLIEQWAKEIPGAVKLTVDWLRENLQPAAEWFITTGWPALLAAGETYRNWIATTLIPALRETFAWLNDKLPPAINWIKETGWPGMQRAGELLFGVIGEIIRFFRDLYVELEKRQVFEDVRAIWDALTGIGAGLARMLNSDLNPQTAAAVSNFGEAEGKVNLFKMAVQFAADMITNKINEFKLIAQTLDTIVNAAANAGASVDSFIAAVGRAAIPVGLQALADLLDKISKFKMPSFQMPNIPGFGGGQTSGGAQTVSLSNRPGTWDVVVPGGQGSATSGGTHGGMPAVDIFAAKGTPILAPVGGTSRPGYYSLGGNASIFYGDDGKFYYFAHGNTPFAPGRIEAGQQFGQVGNTGNAASTPPHLHFAVASNPGVFDRFNGSGDIDPSIVKNSRQMAGGLGELQAAGLMLDDLQKALLASFKMPENVNEIMASQTKEFLDLMTGGLGQSSGPAALEKLASALQPLENAVANGTVGSPRELAGTLVEALARAGVMTDPYNDLKAGRIGEGDALEEALAGLRSFSPDFEAIYQRLIASGGLGNDQIILDTLQAILHYTQTPPATQTAVGSVADPAKPLAIATVAAQAVQMAEVIIQQARAETLLAALVDVTNATVRDASFGSVGSIDKIGSINDIGSQSAQSLRVDSAYVETMTVGTQAARAMGGPVRMGATYLVGERGPELFAPNGSGTITANDKAGGTTEYHVHTNTYQSAAEVIDELRLMEMIHSGRSR